VGFRTEGGGAGTVSRVLAVQQDLLFGFVGDGVSTTDAGLEGGCSGPKTSCIDGARTGAKPSASAERGGGE